MTDKQKLEDALNKFINPEIDGDLLTIFTAAQEYARILPMLKELDIEEIKNAVKIEGLANSFMDLYLPNLWEEKRCFHERKYGCDTDTSLIKAANLTMKIAKEIKR